MESESTTDDDTGLERNLDLEVMGFTAAGNVDAAAVSRTAS
ncbi:hypothetical protein [Rhizobium sp. PDO1-076]|nr:hypothetical protein [Rhizobium sp. PDO1-076]